MVNNTEMWKMEGLSTIKALKLYDKDRCMMGELYNGYCYGLAALNARMPWGYYHALL